MNKYPIIATLITQAVLSVADLLLQYFGIIDAIASMSIITILFISSVATILIIYLRSRQNV